MSAETLHNTIRGRFHAKVASVASFGLQGKVQYDNQPMPTLTDRAKWCRFTIRTGETLSSEFGSDQVKEKTVGIAYAQLFGPPDEGDGELLELGDSIANQFRRLTVTGVKFLTPTVKPIGFDGTNYQVNVEIPFLYTVTKQKGSV